MLPRQLLGDTPEGISMDSIVKTIIKKFGIGGIVEKRGFHMGKALFELRDHKRMVIEHNRSFWIHGYKWKRASHELRIDLGNESSPHMIIVGMSGFGKSTTLRSIVRQISESGKPAIIFDAHNEHERVVSSCGGKVYNSVSAGINILSLDGFTVGERISELSSLLTSVYSLGQIQSTKLAECLWYVYKNSGAMSRRDICLAKNPTTRDLLAEIGVFIKNAQSAGERNSLTSMRSKLSSLATGAFEGKMEGIAAFRIGINSFSLAGLASREVRTIYLTELLARLYSSMRGMEKERGINLYLIVDEAQQLLGGTEDEMVLKKMMEEGRKYGVSVIIATHLAISLPRSMVGNASTFISFYSREPSELNYVSNLFGNSNQEKSKEVKSMLSALKKHQAMMMSTEFKRPVVIATARPEPETGKDTGHILETVRKIVRRPATIGAIKERLSALGLQNECENTVESIPNIQTGRGKLYMAYAKNRSIDHEASIIDISKNLDGQGIDNRTLNGKNEPDISVRTSFGSIAIEYETGRKNIQDTVRMVLKRLEKYLRVLIVVNDDSYSRYAGEKGFKIRGVDILRKSEIGRIGELLSSKP
jgi:hypothetical protein